MATRNDRLIAGLVLAAVFGALVWPVVFSGRSGANEAWDQNKFHLPVIRRMAEEWPHVDLVNYETATTPGHHLTLTVVSKLASSNVAVLQFVNSLFSLVMILFVWHWVARRVGPWPGLALVSPLVFAQSFLGSAIWITTDNVALLFVVLALAVCVRGVLTPGRAVLGSVWAMLAVLVRQLHLWLAAPVALAMMLRSPAGCAAPPMLCVDSNQRWSWGRTIGALASVALPFAVVIAFVSMWGGLTPPRFAEHHGSGPNSATPAFILSLIGGFGLFYLPFFVRGSVKWSHCVVGAAAGLVVAVIPVTFESQAAGRNGGAMWELAARLPNVADRSIVITLAAAIGGFMLVRIWQACRSAGRGREVTILMFALLTWTMAQSMNAKAWQRYCEPMVLILLAWCAALAVGGSEDAKTQASASNQASRRAWIGPAALALIQAGITAAALYAGVMRSGQ